MKRLIVTIVLVTAATLLAAAQTKQRDRFQATDFVLWRMSPQSVFSIWAGELKVAGNASAAARPAEHTASAETNLAMKAEILTFSRARRLRWCLPCGLHTEV